MLVLRALQSTIKLKHKIDDRLHSLLRDSFALESAYLGGTYLLVRPANRILDHMGWNGMEWGDGIMVRM
jgi:hypothetical protein